MQNEKALFFSTYRNSKLPFHLRPLPLELSAATIMLLERSLSTSQILTPSIRSRAALKVKF